MLKTKVFNLRGKHMKCVRFLSLALIFGSSLTAMQPQKKTETQEWDLCDPEQEWVVLSDTPEAYVVQQWLSSPEEVVKKGEKYTLKISDGEIFGEKNEKDGTLTCGGTQHEKKMTGLPKNLYYMLRKKFRDNKTKLKQEQRAKQEAEINEKKKMTGNKKSAWSDYSSTTTAPTVSISNCSSNMQRSSVSSSSSSPSICLSTACIASAIKVSGGSDIK